MLPAGRDWESPSALRATESSVHSSGLACAVFPTSSGGGANGWARHVNGLPEGTASAAIDVPRPPITLPVLKRSESHRPRLRTASHEPAEGDDRALPPGCKRVGKARPSDRERKRHRHPLAGGLGGRTAAGHKSSNAARGCGRSHAGVVTRHRATGYGPPRRDGRVAPGRTSPHERAIR
jgi:hypothetical protein